MNNTKKYKINEDFFDTIDSEVKAYFLGFLFADGYNNEKRGTVRLALKETDLSILETFRSYIYPENNRLIGRAKKFNCIDLRYLDITNRHISNKLSELGVLQNKTFITNFPNIPEELYSHFIRGYMDGDGCINSFIFKGKYFKCQLRIIGTLKFCKSIQEIINKNCNTTGSIRKRGNIFELAYGGRNQVIKACEYIYKNSNIFLQRKYIKYEEIKQYKDARFKI